MPVKVRDLICLLESYAPPRLAESWDNVGLLAGSPESIVDKVLLTLDVTPDVVKKAVGEKAQLIISHHPLLFSPVKSLAQTGWQNKMLAELIKNDIAVYSAHTNLDIAEGGVNDVLAAKLSLNNVGNLYLTQKEQLRKIAVFVPVSHAEQVACAMTEAGAGHIGKYSGCTFQAKGTGTFRPLAGASPFIGEAGRLERVEEVKIETVVTQECQQSVLAAMLATHPYEEVAYDMYSLLNSVGETSLGRIGELAEEMTVREFAAFARNALYLPGIRYADAGKPVKKVAVCGGAGGDLVKEALVAGADVLLTGDVKYHAAQEATFAGLSIVDAGHQGTERHIMPVLAAKIEDWATACKQELKVLLADEEEIFKFL